VNQEAPFFVGPSLVPRSRFQNVSAQAPTPSVLEIKYLAYFQQLLLFLKNF